MEYTPPSTAGFNADEELARLISHMQSLREAHEQEKQREAQARAEARKKENFQKKQQEGKFLLDIHQRQPWRLGDQHLPVNFEKEVKPLPPGDIHPMTLYRTKNFIPRTYEVPPKPFISTTQTAQLFPSSATHLLAKSAQATFAQRRGEFDAEVERRRKQEMKRKQVVFANRWEPPGAGSRNLSTPPSDQYYLFEKGLKDRPMQEKPFLRTKRDGELFS